MKKLVPFMLTIMVSVALFGCSAEDVARDTKIALNKQKFIIIDSQSSSKNEENGYRTVGKETSDTPRCIPNFKGDPIHLLLLK